MPPRSPPPAPPTTRFGRLSSHYADNAAAGALLRVADELRAQQASLEANAASQAAMERLRSQDLPIISAAEWVSNPYYTGGFEIWPKIRDLFIEIVETKKTFIVLRGSAGWGKTTLVRLLALRSAYEIGCYAAPHSTIGQFSPWRPLRITFMSVDKDKAREHLFDPFAAMVRRSNWFSEHYRAQNRLYNNTGFNFLAMSRPGAKDPSLRISPDPTTPDEIVGDDVVSAFLTECNKYEYVETSKRARQDGSSRVYDVAMAIYRELLARLTTRFQVPYEPCVRMVFDSSERYDEDFVSRLVRELPLTGIPFGIYGFSNWQTRPGQDTAPYFWFAKPRRGVPAEVVESEERRAQLLELGREIITVPEGREQANLKLARQMPDDFAQNHVGCPTDAVSRFIGDPESIDRCRDARVRWLLENNLVGVRSAVPDRFLLDYTPIDWAALCRMDENGISRPLVLPYTKRFAHFDLATSGDDFVGFAVGCPAGYLDDRPLVWIDLALRIERQDKEYDFEKLRQLIADLTQNGFSFEQISFDSWQSFDFGQQLEQGYRVRVERISLHADIDGYMALRNALYQQRVLLDANSVLTTELVQLERRIINGKEKVNHRAGGHDDVADAVAGVVWEVTKLGAPGRQAAYAVSAGRLKPIPLPVAIPPNAVGYESTYVAALQRVMRQQDREKRREERRQAREVRRSARRGA